MANLIISDDLAQKLNRLAQERHSRIEDVIALAIQSLAETAPEESPDRTSDLDDGGSRSVLYLIAREYWQRTGNTERLALSNADLDAQFWLIDHEGIPRLKSEQGTITLPHDPLEDLIGLIEDGPSDLSTSVRETMGAVYQGKYGRPD